MGVSSETQGQQIGQNEVNRAEIVAAKVFYKSISSWETSLSRRYIIYVIVALQLCLQLTFIYCCLLAVSILPCSLLAVNIYLLQFACG